MKYSLAIFLSLFVGFLAGLMGLDLRIGKAEEKTTAVSFYPSPHESTLQVGADWMQGLDGQIQLSQLSIPGTHDTCALLNGFSFGFAKCQSWSLSSQLEAGIRFLDIRCRHRSNRFEIYHGVIDQKISFSEVLEVCVDFLETHPGECLLMSVKEESKAEQVSRSFKETFEEEIKNCRDLWVLNSSKVNLDQARGKIILLDRVGNLGGLSWSQMSKQDDYQALPDIKKEKITRQFDRTEQGDPDQWFLNYSSGTVPRQLLNPAAYASQVNPFVLEEVGKRKGKRLGVVIMDFPGDELLQSIIHRNQSFLNSKSKPELSKQGAKR